MSRPFSGPMTVLGFSVFWRAANPFLLDLQDTGSSNPYTLSLPINSSFAAEKRVDRIYIVDFSVACSTVTVTKCQAALRTLQAFPFFKPTCLCREPHVDPECSTFRDFLFDHPCLFVHKKGKTGDCFFESVT